MMFKCAVVVCIAKSDEWEIKLKRIPSDHNYEIEAYNSKKVIQIIKQRTSFWDAVTAFSELCKEYGALEVKEED